MKGVLPITRTESREVEGDVPAIRGPFPGQVTLEWDGGRPAFQVFRVEDPSKIVLPSSVVAETDKALWVETPPPGRIYYYRVLSRP